MKKLILLIILLSILCLVPVVPYDKPVSSGVVLIEHKTIPIWLMEQYHMTQQRKMLKEN